ncbi:hypothetical protein ACFV7R_44125 [Streptomyces sp. NPDC059866]|uniref:hypothetical protein n=1 Tax=Streptomyces sp. NPDC059866 TaxID=3346978 RepID=UPI0036608B82
MPARGCPRTPGRASCSSPPVCRSKQPAGDRHQKHATLQVARIRPAETLEISTAPFAHLFIARDTADLEGAGLLAEGDAVRVTGSEGQRLTGGPDGAEVLMWEMHAAASMR